MLTEKVYCSSCTKCSYSNQNPRTNHSQPSGPYGCNCEQIHNTRDLGTKMTCWSDGSIRIEYSLVNRMFICDNELQHPIYKVTKKQRVSPNKVYGPPVLKMKRPKKI